MIDKSSIENATDVFIKFVALVGLLKANPHRAKYYYLDALNIGESEYFLMRDKIEKEGWLNAK